MMLNRDPSDRFAFQYLTLMIFFSSLHPFGCRYLREIDFTYEIRCKPVRYLYVCTTSVTEGEVARVKLV